MEVSKGDTMYTIEYNTNTVVVKKEGLPSYSMRLGVSGSTFFGKGTFNLDTHIDCMNIERDKPREDYTVKELAEMYDKAAKLYILRTKDNMK